MLISGWGGYPKVEADVLIPRSISESTRWLNHSPLIARGMGRSYGDSALNANVLQTTRIDHFLAFDQQAGLITVEAGVSLRALLELVVPKGWFLPVTPGTSYVTVGGAIASDVHGKNHHGAGTFGQHVASMTLLLGTGEVVNTSANERPDLFEATCGGMGLTGVILNATIRLQRISSLNIRQKTLKSKCIEEVCEQFDVHQESRYSVAWIDCLATGRYLGRSVLMLGEHETQGSLDFELKAPLTVPFYTPASLLNPWSMKAFNHVYYAKAQHGLERSVHLMPYFYPLDALGGWNKLYGQAGFVQYQCVVPKDQGVSHLKTLLNTIANAGTGSFLAVLKQFGPANQHLLSFPKEGYTLALDFKWSSATLSLIQRLDDMLLSMGGRVYLTKDAVMKASTFKASYPKWEAFEAIRHQYGAIGKFASVQSKRLGLL